MQLKVTRSGSRTYLQIVQAYRDPATGKPRQRHVASLGRLDSLRPADFDALISGLARVAGTPPPTLPTPEAALQPAPSVPRAPCPLRALTLLLHQMAPDAFPRPTATGPHNLDPLVAHVAAILAPTAHPTSPRPAPPAGTSPATAQSLRHVAAEIQRRSQASCHDSSAIVLELLSPSFVEALLGSISSISGAPSREPGAVLVVARSAAGIPLAVDVLPTPMAALPFTRQALGRVCRRLPRGPRRLLLAPAATEPTLLCHYMTTAAGRPILPMAATSAALHETFRERVLAASRLAATPATPVASAPFDGLRLLLLPVPGLRATARRARARNVVAALRLARALTAHLDAQDAPGSASDQPVLTDVVAQQLLARQLEALGLAECIAAELEDGRFFTWRWRPEALRDRLALDGVVALLTGSGDISDQEVGGYFTQWLGDAQLLERALGFGGVVADVAELVYVALAVAHEVASRLRRSGSALSMQVALREVVDGGEGDSEPGEKPGEERYRELLAALDLLETTDVA